MTAQQVMLETGWSKARAYRLLSTLKSCPGFTLQVRRVRQGVFGPMSTAYVVTEEE